MAAMHVVARSLLIATLLVGCGSTSLSSTGDPASADPPLERMSLAQGVSEKIGVPVDVRYEFDGSPGVNRPATLNLAFVPRVSGQNLRVEFPSAKDIRLEGVATPLTARKAEASGAFRRNLIVTPLSATARELRVVVSMDVGGGRYFGVYVIPFAAPAETQQK
jgi:hypothetical protein